MGAVGDSVASASPLPSLCLHPGLANPGRGKPDQST